MAQIPAQSPSASFAKPYATLVGIVGSVIASSSLFLPVLIGTTVPHCLRLHCFPISPEISLFSAWGVVLQVTAAPLLSLRPIIHIIHYPAIILAPTFIAILLLGITVLATLVPARRWLSHLRLALAAIGLLYLLFEDIIAYFTYASQPPNAVPHPSPVSLILALATMYGGYALIMLSAMLGRRSALRG